MMGFLSRLMRTGMLSAMLSTKASKEKIGKTFMTPTYMVMSRGCGCKEAARGSEGKSVVGHGSSQRQRKSL